MHGIIQNLTDKVAAGWNHLALRQHLVNHAIRLKTPISDEESSNGTGFLLDGAYILSAEHCLVPGSTTSIKHPNLDLGQARVIAVDKQADLALLCLTNPVEHKRRVKLAKGSPKTGDPAFFHSGTRGKFIQTRFRRNKRPTPWIGFDDVVSGDSGSAVLNAQGELCSVIKATLERTNGETILHSASFGPDIWAIRRFLKENWPLYEA